MFMSLRTNVDHDNATNDWTSAVVIVVVIAPPYLRLVNDHQANDGRWTDVQEFPFPNHVHISSCGTRSNATPATHHGAIASFSGWPKSGPTNLPYIVLELQSRIHITYVNTAWVMQMRWIVTSNLTTEMGHSIVKALKMSMYQSTSTCRICLEMP